MKNHRRSILQVIVVSALIGLSFSSHAADLCSAIFSETLRVIESLDQEYSVITETDSTKRAAKVTSLLNRALFPMMEQFTSRVERLSTKEIVKETAEAAHQFSTQWGTFEKNPFGVRRAQVKDSDAQALFDYNAKTATSYYEIHKRPNAFLHSDFVYVMPDKKRVAKMGAIHDQFSTFVTPIGEYGPDFASKMMRTTQVMARIAERELEAISAEIYKKNQELLNAESARASGRYNENAIPKLTPASALIEGIFSFHQLVNIMLATRIPGIETGEQALKAFIFDGAGHMGLTAGLTSRIPMAMVGPMSLAGYGYRNALVLNADGKLEPTEELKTTLAALMDKNVGNSGGRRAVCPMASFFRGKPTASLQAVAPAPLERGKAGLQLLAEAYWRVFETISKQDEAALQGPVLETPFHQNPVVPAARANPDQDDGNWFKRTRDRVRRWIED